MKNGLIFLKGLMSLVAIWIIVFLLVTAAQQGSGAKYFWTFWIAFCIYALYDMRKKDL